MAVARKTMREREARNADQMVGGVLALLANRKNREQQ